MNAEGLLIRDGRVHLRGRVSRSLDLSVPAGSHCWLSGRNGSGKTTLLRALAGAVEMTSAAATIFGSSLGVARRHGDVTLVNSRPRFPPDINVQTWLREWSIRRGIDEGALSASADEWGVGPYWTRPASLLSEGMRMRCALAGAFSNPAGLVLLDEVAAPLDSEARDVLQLAIERVTLDGGIALEVSHSVIPGESHESREIAWLL